MSEDSRSQHEPYKPTWGPDSTLLYAIPGLTDMSRSIPSQADTILTLQKAGIVSGGRAIRFAKFAVTPDVRTRLFVSQRSLCHDAC